MARFLLPGAARPAPRTDQVSVVEALAVSRAKLAGSDFHYAILFAAPGRRPPLTALYALWREIDEIADECSDPAVAAHKLAWWREEIDALFAARARHPASIALRLLAHDDLAREPLDRLLDAVARSFTAPGFDSIDALLEHARAREGTLVTLAARLLGAPDAALADLGAGLRLGSLIARLGADVRRGRLELPRDELARRGIAEADVRERRQSPALLNLLAGLHERALPLLALPATLPSIDRARLAPLAALGAIARATLAEVARDGYRVLDRGVALTPLRKLWVAWRASRAAARA